MSIARYYQNFAAVCDYCDKQLPGEFTYDAAVRAKRAAGWERRKVDGEWVDICTDCQFEEKGYEDDNRK